MAISDIELKITELASQQSAPNYGQVDGVIRSLADTLPDEPSHLNQMTAASAIGLSSLVALGSVASAESGTPPTRVVIDQPGDTLSQAASEVGVDWRSIHKINPDLVHVGDEFLGCKTGQALMPEGWNATIFSVRNRMTLEQFKLANPDVTNIDVVSADKCYNLTDSSPAMREYTVKKGDTVHDIAGGNTSLTNRIIEENGLTMLPGGVVMIYPGEVLRIPAPDNSTPPAQEISRDQDWQQQQNILLAQSNQAVVQLPAGFYISHLSEAISRVTDGELKVRAVQEAIITQRGGDEHFQAQEPISVPGVNQNVVDMAVAWLATEAILDQQPVLPNDDGEVMGIQLSSTFERYWDLPSGEGQPFKTPEEADEFRAAVEAMSQRLSVHPDYMMAVMAFETGGTFDPSIVNGAGSGATGLIQFMPSTARNLGTSTAELSQMTALEQLKYVEMYFQSSAGQLRTLNDVYLKVFFPAAIGRDANYILPGYVYRQNRGFDTNHDGNISVGEISQTVHDVLDQAPLLTSLPTEVEVAEEASSSVVAEEQEPAPQYHSLVRLDTLRVEADGIQTVEIGDNLNIRVRIETANSWAGLIEEAARNGFDLTAASSHRSRERQRQLREQNCPDPIRSRPGECSPETGWVGDEPASGGRHSDHLDGEAVDLRVNGQSLTSWHTPGSKWLQENAPKFGIHPTVSSEPWHYAADDINGQE